jgi:hypothetical protein
MDYLGKELIFARSQGWLQDFLKAGKDYEWDPTLLLAIASRETNVRNIVGDGGHGYGMMQIDVRSYPDFCHSGQWRNPGLVIHTGALVLDAKRTQIEKSQGLPMNIGGWHFVGQPISGENLIRVSVAAYNCGLWAYYCFSRGEDPDRLTTGRNYSADVLRRKAEFDKLWSDK